MDDETWSFVVGIVLGAIGGGLLCALIVRDAWKDEAVSKGFATYTVNERGSVTWAWKGESK